MLIGTKEGFEINNQQTMKLTGGLRWMQSTSNSTSHWYVYLLRCNDATIYTGCTNNIEDRLQRHNRGEIHYTKTRLPVQLETCIVFTDKYRAYDFERYLKSGSGIAFRNKRFVGKSNN